MKKTIISKMNFPGANLGRLPQLDHRATVGPTLATKFL